MTAEKESKVDEISYDEQEYLERTALLGLEYVLADFAREFQQATRRWERIAWPVMIVFGLLAISGFWLIYSITEDMHSMSKNIDPLMSQHLGDMSWNIATLTQSIEHMDSNITKLRADITEMNIHMASMDESIGIMQPDIFMMSGNIAEMSQAVNAMTWNTGVMSQDMGRLNRSIGKPMRFMNNFLP